MDITKQIKYGLRLNFYLVKYIWPVLRLFVKKSRRCSVCTLSEAYVEIENGVCEICRNADLEKSATGGKQSDLEDKLNAYLEKVQRKGRQYDALVFFSGGKDSTYMLYRLKKDYPGLRILAFTVDNGFRSPFGTRNAERVCRYFNVDHMEVRPYSMFRKLYEYGFRNLSSRSFYCIDFWEGELFQDIGRNIAAGMKIPVLVLGYTSKQIGMFPPEYNQYNQYTTEDFKTKKKNIFTRKNFLSIKLQDIFDSDEMQYWWDSSRYLSQNIPEVIFPFNVWEYDKKQIEKQVRILKIVEDDHMDPMLTNDLYCTLGVYLDYRIFKYCSIEPEWAQLVREGVEDRIQNRNMWEFVEYISLRHKNLILDSPEVKFILNAFKITKDDINNIEKTAQVK